MAFENHFEIYLNTTEILQHGVMWLDRNGGILGVNSSFAKDLGYDKSAFSRKTIFQVNPKTTFMEWQALWEKLLEEHQVTLETEQITSTGTLFPIRLKGLLLYAADEPLCLAIVESLLDSNRYHDLLRLTERISQNGSWEWDLLHEEVIMTEGLCNLLDIPIKKTFQLGEVKALFANKLFPREMGELTTELQNAAGTGKAFEMELAVRSSEGPGTRYLNLSAQPVQQDGQTHKVCGTLRDLSGVAARTDEMYLMQFCVDNAAQMVHWLDPEGNFIYANKAFCEQVGYTRDELADLNIFEVEPGLEKKHWKNRWKQLKKQKRLEILSTRRTRSGEELPVRLMLNHVDYGGKEFELAFAIPQEGTKGSGELMELALLSLRQAKEMVYWLTPDGTLFFFNDTFCEKLGYERREVEGKRLLDFMSGATEEKFEVVWKKLSAGEVVELEREMTHKDGHTIPVEATASLVKFGDKEYSCTTMRDVSARKRREGQLRLAFESIQQGPEMVFWLNPDGTFRFFNEAFQKKTGYARKAIEQMRILDFFPQFAEDAFTEGWERLRSDGTLSSEMLMTLKDGSQISVESNVSLVRVGDEEYSSTVLRDITKRKDNQLKLKRQLEEIERLRRQLEAENIQLKEDIKVERGVTNIISRSPRYKPVLRQIGQVAETDATVLVLGETGTGKELVAKAIHQLSNRSDRPMIKINCGALLANLIESEFFGHEKGAFTGAFQRKIGRFETAHQGTLFLDEIGELPLDLQSKLLRVLQEGEFERVGGNETISVNVRVIAATNRNLEELSQKGKFRQDLYYRINVFPIHNIPLRDRKEDIPILVKHFIGKYNKKLGKKVEEVPQAVMENIMLYEFPGNVRELENIVERAVILSQGKRFSIDFEFKRKRKNGKEKVFPSMEQLQQEHILKALRRANGKITGKGGAAELLGMKDKTLYSRMTKFGIKKMDFLK